MLSYVVVGSIYIYSEYLNMVSGQSRVKLSTVFEAQLRLNKYLLGRKKEDRKQAKSTSILLNKQKLVTM